MSSITSYIINPIIQNPWTLSGLAAGITFGMAAKVYKAGTNWFFDKKYEEPEEKTSQGWRFHAKNAWRSINKIREGVKDDPSANFCKPGTPSILMIPSLIFASCFAYQNYTLIQAALNEVKVCKVSYLPLDPNLCPIQDASKEMLFQVVLPILGTTLYPFMHTMISDTLCCKIRKSLKTLSVFKDIDISGHGEYQALFSIQVMLTTHAVNKFSIPMISTFHKIMMIPILLSDLVWSYETISKHYHSVAEVLAGLACAATAHVGLSLIEASVLSLYT